MITIFRLILIRVVRKIKGGSINFDGALVPSNFCLAERPKGFGVDPCYSELILAQAVALRLSHGGALLALCGHMWITFGDKGCRQEVHVQEVGGHLCLDVTICGSLLATKVAFKKSM